jgi:large subunit ribosomal protein L18
MNRLQQVSNNLARRKARIRKIVRGTAERPRLSVFVSNTNISAQIINDDTHQTLIAVSTVGSKEAKGTMTEKAAWVGEQVAAKAKTAKITSVVFDRNGRLYHGRIKALADKAREGGLEF